MSETGDEANQDASLKGHGEENDEYQPETDPHPACEILDPVVFTKLHINTHQVGVRGQLTRWLTRHFILQQQSGALDPELFCYDG